MIIYIYIQYGLPVIPNRLNCHMAVTMAYHLPKCTVYHAAIDRLIINEKAKCLSF